MSLLTKILCVGLFAASFLSGFAEAQTVTETTPPPTRGTYATGSLSVDAFLDTGAALEMTGGFGFERLLLGLDVRASLGLIAKDGVALKVAGDVLYGFGIGDTNTFGVALGAGPRLVVGRNFDVGVGALANLDFALDERVSVFVEPGLDVYFLGATQLAPKASLGVRYRF